MTAPEILSPCGSVESLRAAVFAGADAVYLGGTSFNARMNARNFDETALTDAVKFCHSYGVKIYVTLNTLILDREMASALEYVSFLYNAGVDALIVADLGLAYHINSGFPDFPLHASTQACGANFSSAQLFKEAGFSRMVCPREMSFDDINNLAKESPIEIEMFVHGALCVSFSGQCLFSSMIGNRSGNRGECAQPCRMTYNRTYPLSLKDMCLGAHIGRILTSGVRSLKIEGRMKSPEYVYAVTSTYRRLIDEKRNAAEKDLDYLGKVFSRSGFTDGYFTNKINSSMIGVRSESDKKETRESHISIIPGSKRADEINIKRSPKAIEFKKHALAEKEYFFTKSARFYRPGNIPDTDYFDHIFLPVEQFTSGCNADGVFLPPFYFDRDEDKIKKLLESAIKNGAKEALITNIGQISLVKNFSLTVHGDFRLNVFNNEAFNYYLSLADFKTIILSPELTLRQMRDIDSHKSAVVYGKLPLMTLYKPCGADTLTDRRSYKFDVIHEFGYDLVLNSVPFYNVENQVEIKRAGINDFHFIFTNESSSEVAEIIECYKNKTPRRDNIKKIK